MQRWLSLGANGQSAWLDFVLLPVALPVSHYFESWFIAGHGSYKYVRLAIDPEE